MSTDRRSTFFRRSPGRTLAVLHLAFALTGICHSIGGPLLPSLAHAFQLNDSQAGFLLFAYFAGTSLGALLCGRRHARTITSGFLALAVAALGVTFTNRFFLYPVFLLFGICVGIPMTTVSMHAGRTFGARSAAPLTFLNFSWSAGALFAPLLASRLLMSHTFRAAYLVLGGAALIAALSCWVQLEDSPEPERAAQKGPGIGNVGLIALFSFVTFLQVGVENTTASWLTTYVLRTSASGAAWAAASSSLYWCGFLASRGLSSLLLLSIDAGRLLSLLWLASWPHSSCLRHRELRRTWSRWSFWAPRWRPSSRFCWRGSSRRRAILPIRGGCWLCADLAARCCHGSPDRYRPRRGAFAWGL